MPLALGIISAILTVIVAIASQKELSLWHRWTLIVATIATIAGSIWSASEQQTFEKYVLGGNSYVYVTFESVGDDASKFVLNFDGEKYPIYDFSLELYDMRKFSNISTNDPRVIGAGIQKIERSVFAPQMAVSMLNNFHPTDCFGYWMAVSQQRNRRVMSVIQARKFGEKWESSTRVYSMDDKTTFIKEYSTPRWDHAIEWPQVNISEAGEVDFTTPTVNCAEENKLKNDTK